MRTAAAAALALFVAACGDDAPAAEPAAEPAERPYVPPEPTIREVVPHAERPLARVAHVGDLDVSSFRAGQALRGDAPLAVEAFTLDVDLREGARISLEPHARVQIGEEAPAQIFVGVGLVRATLPPEGGSARPPLRIGSLDGTVEIGGSADVWVAANAAGQTWVAVVQGRASATSTTAEGEDHTLELGPGQSVVLGQDAPSPGPRNANEARAAGRLVLEQASPTHAETRLAELTGPLREALAEAEAEVARGRELTAGPRPERGSAEAQARQAALVEHGRALIRTRRRLLVRYERAVAWGLFATAQTPDATPPPLPRDDVRRALGL
ncbi:MAG: hypothetical protein KF901_21960 [Myxococcales bacterium]|nr:hypothetical protein [Myxococcales bacterium]